MHFSLLDQIFNLVFKKTFFLKYNTQTALVGFNITDYHQRPVVFSRVQEEINSKFKKKKKTTWYMYIVE